MDGANAGTSSDGGVGGSVGGGADKAVSAPVAPSVLSTLNDDGSRKWLNPRPSPGRFRHRRAVVAFSLIALFTLLPFIRLHGKQAFLLDIATRRFTIFGATFLPTDAFLLALLAITVFVSIFFLTAVVGRVWCGWACPQTVYMEYVYRPLERFFTGTPGKPAKNWFQKSGSGLFFKYVVYFLVSVYLANTFLAYFVGVDRLAEWVRSSPFRHPSGFMVMAGTTALMMFDFCFFREQTCIVACPYGRFQSVMLDRSTLIVGYDRVRGEPRGKGKRADIALPVVMSGVESSAKGGAKGGSALGDCIDCRMCVTTCPTGIDIRNGLQMECIHCAQCIDACDAVMEKIGKPKGLVRYSSQVGLEGQAWRLVRPRLIIYPTVLLVVVSVLVYKAWNRDPAYVHVERGRGATFYMLPTGEVANPLRIKLINRRDHTMEYSLTVPDGSARVIAESSPVRVESFKAETLLGTIVAAPGVFEHGEHVAHITISDSEGFSVQATYRMMGPRSETATPTTPAHDNQDEHNDLDHKDEHGVTPQKEQPR